MRAGLLPWSPRSWWPWRSEWRRSRPRPFELATRVLDDPAWSVQALEDAVATGRTRTITLRQPIPVLLLYWTAAFGGDARTYFLPDVYDRDPPIVRALAGGFAFLGRPALRGGA